MTLKKQLDALNPTNVLKRGYTVIRQNGNVVDSQKKLENGKIELTFSDGSITKSITEH